MVAGGVVAAAGAQQLKTPSRSILGQGHHSLGGQVGQVLLERRGRRCISVSGSRSRQRFDRARRSIRWRGDGTAVAGHPKAFGAKARLTGWTGSDPSRISSPIGCPTTPRVAGHRLPWPNSVTRATMWERSCRSHTLVRRGERHSGFRS